MKTKKEILRILHKYAKAHSLLDEAMIYEEDFIKVAQEIVDSVNLIDIVNKCKPLQI